MSETPGADVQGRVLAVVGRVFKLPPEDVAGDLQLGNPPQWDSFGHMQLLMEIENEFGVRFETHEIAGLASVENIVGAVRERAGSQ